MVVLSIEETRSILENARGIPGLILELIYGGGLRISEAVTLRVKDIDFDMHTITVRSGKGDRDRTTLLPGRVDERLKQHLSKVKALHERDVGAGLGEAPLPTALASKYPGAAREWGWQYAFPSRVLAADDSGVIRRWHVAGSTVQKLMKKAVRASGVTKMASVHTLRHSFATHLLMQGVGIRRIRV